MGYDTWKATNPADEFLGPSPEELAAEMEAPELTDTETDVIWNEAWLDAINGSPRLDRYQDDRQKLDFYEHAYRMNYAKENGY